MLNKRLMGVVPGCKQYIAQNVALQWCALAANIAMIFMLGLFLQALLRGGAQGGMFWGMAAVMAAAALVRFLCTKGAARAAFYASKEVKKALRGLIYRKLLRLGAAYTQNVPTAEVVQLAGEGTEQLETYFGAYLPQLFYSMLAPGTIFACVLAFALARGVLHYAEQACNHYIAFKLLALIRDKVFTALRRLAPARLEGRDKGELISILTADIELLEVFYAHTISPVCIAAIVSATMALFIGQYHPALGVLALAAYLVVGVAVPIAAARSGRAAGEAFRARFGALNAFVLDSLRGLRESIQYGAGMRRLAELDAQTDALSQQEEKMKAGAGTNAAVTGAVILVCSAAMLFCSAWLCQRGALGFDGVLTCTIAMMSSFGPVVALANLGSSLQNTLAAGNRVLDILDGMPAVEQVQNGVDIVFCGAGCEQVSFSYGGAPVLRNVSLSFPEGAVVGIVGRSGCGKSTLLKLLMRFWDADSGTVRISGQDIRTVNTVSLRSAESFVVQDTQLFHDSIENNVKLAKLSATHEEVVQACKKAAVHDFIMTLPQGYATPVGELG